MNDPLSSNPSPTRGRRRGLLIAGAVLGVLTLLVGAKAYVFAQGGGWHHGPRHGSITPERAANHIERFVKYALSDTDATSDQKTQVTAILQAAATDLFGLRSHHLAARNQIHEILSAETIDRARLEAVRADELRLADQASRRILQGVADAAEVLTPEQRKQVAALVEEHHRWHGGEH